MNKKSLENLQKDETLRKRLAKFMTKFCFRNSKLENFHDRISQDEMKEIMISMSNNSLLFLSTLFTTEKSNGFGVNGFGVSHHLWFMQKNGG
ncbi:MAG TPA: hypothetical protein VJI96_03530 [Candidatus Andersenbacteria bacterium]|nr:hypothetical protein [Candidatus Andersenbacteria bacterium]